MTERPYLRKITIQNGAQGSNDHSNRFCVQSVFPIESGDYVYVDDVIPFLKSVEEDASTLEAIQKLEAANIALMQDKEHYRVQWVEANKLADDLNRKLARLRAENEQLWQERR